MCVHAWMGWVFMARLFCLGGSKWPSEVIRPPWTIFWSGAGMEVGRWWTDRQASQAGRHSVGSVPLDRIPGCSWIWIFRYYSALILITWWGDERWRWWCFLASPHDRPHDARCLRSSILSWWSSNMIEYGFSGLVWQVWLVWLLAEVVVLVTFLMDSDSLVVW